MSWGNTDGHNPFGQTFEQWTFSQAAYTGTPGADITYPDEIGLEDDIAHKYCGPRWRIPTNDEFLELLDNTDFIDRNGNVISGTNKQILVDGVRGILLRSKINGARLFLPCCGYGLNTNLETKAVIGVYWSKTLYSSVYPWVFDFTSANVKMDQGNFNRYYGLPVRPVFDMNN